VKRRNRILISLAVVIILLLVVGYAAGGAVVYNRLSLVSANCPNFSAEQLENSPAAFTTVTGSDTDVQPYQMATFQTVDFPSREDNVNINAWYVPAQDVDETTAPAVILVHGVNSCKRSASILMPAGMLNKAGFNVLMIDLRNHGDSQVVDGRYAAGTVEYRDVLGAWDWLVNEKGFAPEKIGLFGTSLGAATVLIAMGEEPRVAATWEDSSYADINNVIDAELARNGFPTVLSSASVMMGKVISSRDVTARSPLATIAKLDGRPLFITHGTADTRLSVQYAYDLIAAAEAEGAAVGSWIVEGSTHVGAMFDHPAEYEQKLVSFFTTSIGG